MISFLSLSLERELSEEEVGSRSTNCDSQVELT